MLKILFLLTILQFSFQLDTTKESNTGFYFSSKYDECNIIDGGYIRYYFGWWIYKTIASSVTYKCGTTELAIDIRLYLTGVDEADFKSNLKNIIEMKNGEVYVIDKPQRDLLNPIFNNIHDAFWSEQDLVMVHKGGKFILYARGNKIGESDLITMDTTQKLIDNYKSIGDFQKTIN
jgi:hypothetical protein